MIFSRNIIAQNQSEIGNEHAASFQNKMYIKY